MKIDGDEQVANLVGRTITGVDLDEHVHQLEVHLNDGTSLVVFADPTDDQRLMLCRVFPEEDDQ